MFISPLIAAWVDWFKSGQTLELKHNRNSAPFIDTQHILRRTSLTLPELEKSIFDSQKDSQKSLDSSVDTATMINLIKDISTRTNIKISKCWVFTKDWGTYENSGNQEE